ncbi:GtrA family protein [Actinoplanes oblitus]|uniref:GtrA family protein n=1 Tax=Actinoplanes oblitus TaxID=3040509 RepID=A0ABY8WDK3_9ACTN|nr:GtrA family protein [Actinoplanes oblitus]WIM95462.1 GtrA family protein [Actinoplanes oblitus]
MPVSDAVGRRGPALARLVRYGLSGAASTVTHFGIGLLGVHLLHLRPVVASTAGFLAGVVVSYLLQRGWVFRSAAGHALAGSKFLVVTGVAVTVNTLVLWLGTEVLAVPYPIVQPLALTLIALVNYSLNARWTFA